MSMKDRTKIMFAEAMEEMTKTTPLEKIRVAHLCEKCGTTTPTFYYYFHDKYELVAWMFLQDYAGELGGAQREYTPELLESMNRRFLRRREFYRKAFEDDSQNSIHQYVIGFNNQIAREAFLHANGVEMSKEQERALRYHTYGVTAMFLDWLRSDETSSEELTDFLFEKTPAFLKDAFSRFPFSAENILQKSGKTTRKKQ